MIYFNVESNKMDYLGITIALQYKQPNTCHYAILLCKNLLV